MTADIHRCQSAMIGCEGELVPDLYPRDFPASARRHLVAADRLIGTDRTDVAGYLYGWAAECALK